MRENAWIYAIMIVAAIIIIYAAVYKGLENNEKRSLGKAGYKRMTDFRIGCSLAKIAKKRKNDRSYFAAATKNIGREWKYEYRADPFLCEITYIPEKGEIVFIVPRQEEFTSDVLIFYKRMRRKARYEAAERLLKSLS
jgi:hypothetical protein